MRSEIGAMARSSVTATRRSAWLTTLLFLAPPTASNGTEPSPAPPPAPRATSLELYNQCVLHVKDDYSDPARIHPREMLIASLTAIATTLPEVHIDAGAASGKVRVGVRDRFQDFDFSGVDSLWRMDLTFKEIYDYVTGSLGVIDDDLQIGFAAVNGMLATLDAHSAVIRPAIFTKLRETARGNQEAKGQGDGGNAQMKPTIATLVFQNIAYSRLDNFSESVAEDLQVALEQVAGAARPAGGIKGVILDLRGNPGGLLEPALRVADQFVSQGTILTTRARKFTQTKQATHDDADVNLPLVVVVDRHTAGSAELVAGALKDLDRAVIVGRRTKGMGTVTVVYELSGRAAFLKLGFAKMIRPSGLEVDTDGIVPDIALTPVIAVPADQLAEKPKLDPPLNPFVAATNPTRSSLREQPTVEMRYLADNQTVPPEKDFEIQVARDLLIAAPFQQRSRMLPSARSVIEAKLKAEAERISAKNPTVELE